MDSNVLNKALTDLGIRKAETFKKKNTKVEKALSDLFEKGKKSSHETSSLPIDKQRDVVVALADRVKAEYKKKGKVSPELKKEYKKELTKYNKQYRSAERIIGQILD